MDVEGKAAHLNQLKQLSRQLLREISFSVAGKALGPATIYSNELRYWNAMVGVEGQRMLHGHSNDGAAERMRVHIFENACDDRYASNLVTVDSGPDIQDVYRRRSGSPGE
jgi:hypothetical protein